MHLLPGSSHVAVGFADLGELAAAASRWGETEAGQLAAFPLEFDAARPDLTALQGDIAEHVAQVQVAVPPDDIDDDDADDDDDAPVNARYMETHHAFQAVQLLQQLHNMRSSSSAGSDALADSNDAAAGSYGCPAAGSSGKPLLWVGYDASPYAVAKAAVLLEIMRRGADTDAVLQVSATTTTVCMPETCIDPHSS